jgi:hypothetical protein
VVRFTVPGDSPVDLVVGKTRWQAAALTRAENRSFADVELPVLRAAEIEPHLGALPAPAVHLWHRIHS